MRIALVASGIAALSLTGCQVAKGPEVISPGKTPSAELAKQRSAERPHRRERVTVEVKVTRLGAGDAIAASRGEIETDRPARFETERAGEVGQTNLELEVEPRGKGTYAVSFQWFETTADGRRVKWAPTLAVSEGVESHAEIAWAEGDGRRITVKLTRPEPASEEVAHR